MLAGDIRRNMRSNREAVSARAPIMMYTSDFAGIRQLRTDYLLRLNSTILSRKSLEPKTLIARQREGWQRNDCISIADTGSLSSMEIAECWAALLPGSLGAVGTAQGTGSTFETILRDFLNAGFELLSSAGIAAAKDIVAQKSGSVYRFDQYSHLATVKKALIRDPPLEMVFGRDYGIKPDIVVYRKRHDPIELGGRQLSQGTAELTPFFADARHANPKAPVLEAIVSCKLTIRSDRVQNIRPEAANAVRTRKGSTPRIVAVTAEPLCGGGRLESIALGTGDVDCVYHSGLPELETAMLNANRNVESGKLKNLVEGRRLRDVSDLLFDLLT